MTNCSDEKKNYLLSIISGLGGGLISGMVIWGLGNLYTPNSFWAMIITIFALSAYGGLIAFAFIKLTGCKN